MTREDLEEGEIEDGEIVDEVGQTVLPLGFLGGLPRARTNQSFALPFLFAS